MEGEGGGSRVKAKVNRAPAYSVHNRDRTRRTTAGDEPRYSHTHCG